MSLKTDQLLDRIKLKSELVKWRYIAISLGIAFLLSLVSLGASDEISIDHIARISVEDIILEDKIRDKVLKDIEKNDNIKAVILYINSPGGTIVGGEKLYNGIRRISEKKPVVATMGSLAASGAYMTAVAADRIFALNGTITGSIGVILQTFEITELSEKLGVKFLNFKSGKLKGTPSPFEKLTPEAKEALQSSINDGFDFFVEIVADRRKMKKSKVLSLADGRIFTGRQALKTNLVDQIGGEKEALEWLKKEKNIDTNLSIKDIDLHPKDKSEKIKDLLGGFAGSFFDNISIKQQGLVSVWKPTNF